MEERAAAGDEDDEYGGDWYDDGPADDARVTETAAEPAAEGIEPDVA